MSAEATTRAEQEQPPLRRALTFLADHPELALVVVLVALMVVTHFVSENGFFRLAQLSTTLQIAGPLAVIAAGQTLVMLTAGIDPSVGNTAAAGGGLMGEPGHEGGGPGRPVGVGG